MPSSSASRLYVLAAAALFSTGGAAIKATTLTGWQVAGFRSAIAAVVIFMFLPPARRIRDWRIWAVATSYALTLLAFVTANKLTTAANAIFLQDSAPLYLLLVGPWLLAEPLRRRDLALMALIAAGALLVFAGGATPSHTAPDPARGNLIALGTGLTWAITIGGLRWVEKSLPGRESGMATVAAGSSLGGAFALPFAFPMQATTTDWAILLYLGLIQVSLGYVLLTRGVRGVSALEASLLILIEPALSPIWAGVVHGEWPAGLALAGGALILGATLAQVLGRD